MQLFVLSEHCKSRVHCVTCRNLEQGRRWRNDIANKFELPEGKVDFDCPHGVPWDFKPEQKIQNTQTPQRTVPPAIRADGSKVKKGCGCSRNKRS
jgi:hypothetical protein